MMSAAVAGPTFCPTPSYTTLRDVTPRPCTSAFADAEGSAAAESAGVRESGALGRYRCPVRGGVEIFAAARLPLSFQSLLSPRVVCGACFGKQSQQSRSATATVTGGSHSADVKGFGRDDVDERAVP